VGAGLLWQKGTAFTLCVCLSLVATQVQRGRAKNNPSLEEQPIIAARSLTRANNSVSQVSALQIIDHLPALGAGFSLLGSPNKQAKSFGVLVFRCRGLFCGVCVFFWDHPCY